MMIPESMLCGTPVVAFNSGGAPDLIETMKTGYLATLKDGADLAKGMYALLSAHEKLLAMRATCREIAVREHSMEAHADRHIDLYRSLLGCTINFPKERP